MDSETLFELVEMLNNVGGKIWEILAKQAKVNLITDSFWLIVMLLFFIISLVILYKYVAFCKEIKKINQGNSDDYWERVEKIKEEHPFFYWFYDDGEALGAFLLVLMGIVDFVLIFLIPFTINNIINLILNPEYVMLKWIIRQFTSGG